MNNRLIPVLITWDVDPDLWTTRSCRHEALNNALELCGECGIRSTFFITANSVHEYGDKLIQLQKLGHEIGCHGLTHSDEENYDRMAKDVQWKYLIEATEKMQMVVGARINAFRSPRVKTSGSTLEMLTELGYRVDSSVCSQRIDLLSSNLINMGWIFAPRRPYHPKNNNPYRKGTNPLWEIPISAFIVPMISAALRVLGVRFMKALFRLLYYESMFTGKPVVYLAHPTESIIRDTPSRQLKLDHFSPRYIRTHGFLFRNLFFQMDGKAWQTATRELFGYIASFPNICFMTMSEYADYLDRLTLDKKYGSSN